MAVVVARGGVSLSNGQVVRTTLAADPPLSTARSLQSPQFPQVEPAPANTFAIVNNANTQVVHVGSGVYSIEKIAGSNGVFDADAVSTVGVTGNFVLRLESRSVTNDLLGLNSDPLTDSDYASIDFAVDYTAPSLFSIYESGVQISTLNAVSTYVWIWRTGTTLGYGSAPTLAAAQSSPTRTTTSSATLYFDSSFVNVGSKYEALFYFPDLVGQSVVSAQGSATAAVSVALTGQSVSVARGSVVAGFSFALTGQSVAVAQGSVSAAVSFALSGQGLTASRGTVVPATSLAIAGQSGVVGQGSVAASASFALTGQAGVVSRGSVLASNSLAVSGQTLTIARGSIAPTAAFALTGQAMSAARGSVTGSTAASLGGAGIVASRGSVATNEVTVALAGMSALIAEGAISPQVAAALTGGGITSASGSLTALVSAGPVVDLIGRRRRRGAFSDYGIWRG